VREVGRLDCPSAVGMEDVRVKLRQELAVAKMSSADNLARVEGVRRCGRMVCLVDNDGFQKIRIKLCDAVGAC
jgi:hypothetical protein